MDSKDTFGKKRSIVLILLFIISLIQIISIFGYYNRYSTHYEYGKFMDGLNSYISTNNWTIKADFEVFLDVIGIMGF